MLLESLSRAGWREMSKAEVQSTRVGWGCWVGKTEESIAEAEGHSRPTMTGRRENTKDECQQGCYIQQEEVGLGDDKS